MYHAMSFSALKSIFFDVDIVEKKIKCGLALSGILSIYLSTTICVILVVKICFRLTRLRLVSPQRFDHCDDV